MISTIELEKKVLQPGLCTNCGACQNLCPYWKSYQGRTLHYFECSKEDGRCLHFCPRLPTDTEALRRRFFAPETILPELGPFRGLYLTRAADPAIRGGSQHGGTMTALVELALREGFIDAAVLTKSSGGLNPQGVLATTEEEIRACRGSSFQIAPALGVLNEALAAAQYQKIGVVGTPCKTLAVYKMRAKPYPENDNHADNISMVFGLFCGWGLDWQGLAALIETHAGETKPRHIDILPSQYHCMELQKENGDQQIELEEIYPLVKNNCRYCTDLTAEFADLSVGGARSGDGWAVDRGWNQVVVRSEKGAALLELAREKAILEFKEVPASNLAKLQRASSRKKQTGMESLRKL